MIVRNGGSHVEPVPVPKNKQTQHHRCGPVCLRFSTLRYMQYPPFHTLPLHNTLPSQHAILVQVLGQEMPGEMEGKGGNEK